MHSVGQKTIFEEKADGKMLSQVTCLQLRTLVLS